MRRLISFLILACLLSAVAVADVSYPSLHLIKQQAQRHHAHKAGKHHAPKRHHHYRSV